jgi:hypothetical protein
LAFSFVRSRFIRKSTAANNDISNILSLKEQLTKVGFNPSEVDYMIMTNSNGCALIDLDSKSIKTIEDLLKEQVRFSCKCLELARD